MKTQKSKPEALGWKNSKDPTVSGALASQLRWVTAQVSHLEWRERLDPNVPEAFGATRSPCPGKWLRSAPRAAGVTQERLVAVRSLPQCSTFWGKTAQIFRLAFYVESTKETEQIRLHYNSK